MSDNVKDITWDDEITWDNKPSDSLGVTSLPQPSSFDNIKQNALNTGAVLGGGALALGAGKWALQPAIDLMGINKEAKVLRGQLGINKGVGVEGIPKQVGFARQQMTAPIKDKIANVKLSSQKSILNAKNQLSQFDNVILNNGVDETAQMIKSGHQDFLNSGYKNYGTGLETSAQLLKDSGVEGIPAETYLSKVVEPALENARNAGIPEEKLTYLTRLQKQLEPKFDAQNIEIDQKPLSLQQAKGYIDNIDNLRLKHSLTDKFGQMLEGLAPEGSVVKGEIATINKAYKPFAQVNNAMYKVIDSKTGTFNDDALTKWLKDYVKTARDTSKANVLKLMSKGNANVNPIEGLAPKVQNIEGLRIQRQGLAGAIPYIKTQANTQVSNLADQLQNEVKRYVGFARKAEELAARAKTAKWGIGKRAAIGAMALGTKAPAILRAMGLMGNVLPYVGAVLQTQTPEYKKADWLKRLYILGGQPVPKKPEDMIL